MYWTRRGERPEASFRFKNAWTSAGVSFASGMCPLISRAMYREARDAAGDHLRAESNDVAGHCADR